MKKLLLVLLISSGSVLLNAQAEHSYTARSIRLLNETIHPSGEITDFDLNQTDLLGERIYLLVQNPALKLEQKTEVFEVLEYIPHNAFIVSVRTARFQTFKTTILAHSTFASYLKPEWKLSRNLYHGNIPEWAWLDEEHIKVWVRIHADFETENLKGILFQLGYEIIDEKPEDHLFALSVKPENVLKVAAHFFVAFVQEMEDPGQPENYTARTDHRVNYLQASYPGTPGYDGSGVVLGHGDDGEIGPHIDYKGRLEQSAGSSNGDHGDHVAGTIFGAGNLNPKGRGMAPGAQIYYQSYPDNLNDADFNYTNKNVRITSSSYSNGCNAGYTNFTVQMDNDAVDNPTMLHVFSAGNDGTSNCQYGAGAGWGNITGGHKIAKNVITVANVTLTDVLAGSSSRGPASDGRIKPDVAAVGSSVYSTTNPNSYTIKTGTSMACPGVSGALATLYQAYKDHNGGTEPKTGLLKSILLNTCDDLGNAGPDFRFGYGRINARRAYDLIAAGNYLTDTMTSSTVNPITYQIPVPSGNVAEARIMLYWVDPAASTAAARALVNDLDLDVSLSSVSYDPWVLDPTPSPAALNAPAVRTRDSLNNIEQVTITNPGSGNLAVSISSFNMATTSQEFYLVYEFVMDSVVLTYPAGGEGFVPGENEYIRWDAPDGTSSFSLEYSTDGGNSWSTISNSVPSGRRYFVWSVPNQITDSARVRITRGSSVSVSPGNFTIIGTPLNLEAYSSCPDSLVLRWDSLNGAEQYIVYQLGALYMDSIGTTADTSFVIQSNNPLNADDWFAVAAVTGNSRGRRTIAINKPTGVFNCTLNQDISVLNLLSPSPILTGCHSASGTPVKVEINNFGLNDAFNFTIHYRVNSGTIQSVTYSDTILAGASNVFTFPGSLPALSNNDTLKLWSNLGNDQNHYNDTVVRIIRVISGSSTVTLPYFNDFESLSSCNTSPDCSNTTCPAGPDFINVGNGSGDDIDWRVNSGSTPSANTGPSVDHNPGSSGGKYLYLEASSGCDSNEAVFLSPCLDLDTSSHSAFQASFWYHMYGANTGLLSVDLITDSGYVTDVIPVLAGNQGVQWQNITVDLNPYAGQKVVMVIRGKTGNGFASDISIDDFSFTDPSITPPVAGLSASDSTFCTGDTIVITDLSNGLVDDYVWDFGNNAIPATATTAGPHHVVYTQPGTKTVQLEVGNDGGITSKVLSLVVGAEPQANFSSSINLNVVTFTDLSTNGPTQWTWDFGDGTTSNLSGPTHTYNNPGTYTIMLTVTNFCGVNEKIDSLTITTGAGLSEVLLTGLHIYPNPAREQVTIEWSENPGTELDITIHDLSGKVIREETITDPGNSGEKKFNISRWPSGIYVISLKTGAGTRNLRLIKN